jgi:diguanylate cyclase (GGDEF)-like protein
LTGQSFYLNKKTIFYLSLPSFLAVLGILLNPGGAFVKAVDGAYLQRDYGPLFWFMVAVAFGYIFLSLYQLLRTLKSNTAPRHKQQVRMALTGIIVLTGFALLDLAVNVVFHDWFSPVRGVISVGIVLSDFYFVIAIMRLKVFEIVRIARSNVIDSMSTGIIVLDEHDVVLEVNIIMRDLFDIREGDRMIMETFLAPYQTEGDTASFLHAYRSHPPEPAQLEITIEDERFRNAVIHTAPILNGRMNLIGRVLTFQDVSELRLLVEASHLQNDILQERNRALIRMQDELFQANQKLEQMAITDSLTGCFNRRYLMQQLEHEVTTNVRYNIPFAIFLFDIDLFKSINDTYGHLVGDEVIRSTAQAVKNSLRRTDILARYGGEEFTVYLPHTNRLEAQLLAERIKETVELNMVEAGHNEMVAITISMGVLTVDENEAEPLANPKEYLKELFSKVDIALYEAKHGGRNRIVHAEIGK